MHQAHGRNRAEREHAQHSNTSKPTANRTGTARNHLLTNREFKDAKHHISLSACSPGSRRLTSDISGSGTASNFTATMTYQHATCTLHKIKIPFTLNITRSSFASTPPSGVPASQDPPPQLPDRSKEGLQKLPKAPNPPTQH